MNNTVDNDFFGFFNVKWLQYTGEVGKCTRDWR